MLPGFRFLFATVVLAVSVLVFGVGAAALLRAAHEEFASLPSWRLAQQPLLAPQFELSLPTLAMLRIEAPAPKSMVETTRPQPTRPDALRLDAIRLNAMRPHAMRDIPDPRPIEAATLNDDGATAHAEPSPPGIAPSAEIVAGLNAQASIETPAAAKTPIEEAHSEANPTEANASESNTVEAKAAESKPDSIQPEARQPETKQTAAISLETEASEPTSPETISALVRSSEATAADPLPNPVVKKATRPSARAIARRRLAIARARAAAREHPRVPLQQQGHNPDPFTQIFGSGGGNVPRPKSG